MAKKVRLSAVAAMGKNRVLAKDGKIPWDLPDEHQHYLNIIKDEVVLIGRNNYDAHKGKPPGRGFLILSSTSNHPLAVRSIEEALEQANTETLYVLGGGKVYESALPFLDELHLTTVDYEGEGEVFFPDIDSYEWKIKVETVHPGWTYRYLVKTSS